MLGNEFETKPLPELDPNWEVFDSFLARDWENELVNVYFIGDRSTAIILIRSFIQGMRDAYDLKRRQGKIPPEFKMPSLKLNRDHWASDAEYEIPPNTVTISSPKLELAAWKNIQQAISFETRRGAIIWHGSMLNWYGSLGAEEMNHCIDTQRTEADLGAPLVPYKPVSQTKSDAEYDASDPEFRALGTKIRTLIDQGSPAAEIQILRERLKAAIEYRQAVRALFKGEQ